ncbi:MAG: hypothetical protein CL694_10480 [Chloroflexi bacterium]|nr:hypothetical protein [Chloroflexota bacterium]HAL47128.1 hypothetical protein [Dehalococcoidia bacterium]
MLRSDRCAADRGERMRLGCGYFGWLPVSLSFRVLRMLELLTRSVCLDRAMMDHPLRNDH